jgi:hypothetical protein
MLSAFVDVGGATPPAKVAVTDCAVVPMVTEQSDPAVLEQPDHDTDPPDVPGVAVSVTVEPGACPAVHVVGPGPQLTEGPDTVPLPLTVTASGTSCSNVAVTFRAVSI